MLTGAHVVVFSSKSQADAEFLRDVLALPHVDAGEGFLIFGLPPAEMALHEAEAEAEHGKHELYLIAEDIHAFVDEMAAASIACEPIAERGWGSVSSITLPSGLKLGVYESHHARPAAKKKAARKLAETAKAVRKATKKSAKAAKKTAKKAKQRA
ncbi:MAG TPA: hypothetical protein VGF94_07420 [Kofleriaceae bacterium]|jgi:hypothetical protein